jgi:hypothetical protein
MESRLLIGRSATERHGAALAPDTEENAAGNSLSPYAGHTLRGTRVAQFAILVAVKKRNSGPRGHDLPPAVNARAAAAWGSLPDHLFRRELGLAPSGARG